MEQEALDDAFLLCDFAHLHNAFVQITAIFVQVLNPPGIALVLCALNVRLVAVLVKQVDALPANGYVRDGNFDAVRKFLHHFASKDINNPHLGLAMPHRWCGRIELAYLLVGMICGSQHQESRVLHTVFIGYCRLPGHVRLPVSKVNMQVRVLRKTYRTEYGTCNNNELKDFF